MISINKLLFIEVSKEKTNKQNLGSIQCDMVTQFYDLDTCLILKILVSLGKGMLGEIKP